jgi:hypothetical protein
LTSIRWTSNTEAVQVEANELEVTAAAVKATILQLRLRDHRQLRKRVNESLDKEEGLLGLHLTNALNIAQARQRTVTAVVGYDLDAGQVVLADPATKQEIGRRPMEDSDRRIAQAMPPPA